MSITLPIEEIVRLRLSFKLGADSRLTFEMLPLDRPLSSNRPLFQTNSKLRLEGKADATGSLRLDVWVEEDVAETSNLEANFRDSSTGTSNLFQDDDSAPFSFHDVFFGQQSLDDAMDISHSEPGGTLPDHLWLNYDSTGIHIPSSVDSTASLLPESYSNLPWGSNMDMNQIMSSFDYHSSGTTGSSINAIHANRPEAMPLVSSPPSTLPSPNPESVLSTPSTLNTPNLFLAGSPDNDAEPQSYFSAKHGKRGAKSDTVDSGTLPSTPHEDTPETSADDFAARPWPCLEPGCPKRFTRNYTRSVHMETHSRAKQERKTFPCRVAGCDEHFGRKHDRLRHEAGIHKLACEWTCKKCSRVFSSETTLEKHLSTSGHSIRQ